MKNKMTFTAIETEAQKYRKIFVHESVLQYFGI